MTKPALSRYRGGAVLAVGAHPDDLEVGAGGTLARLAREGARVTMAVLSAPVLPDVRRGEARKAAALLGCELAWVSADGRHVEDLKTYEIVAALDVLVKRLRPRLLIAHGHCDRHRDHGLAAAAAECTLRLGRFDHWRFATGSRASAPAFAPSLYVDIGATLQRKLAAVEAHASQFGDRGRGVEPFRAAARELGRAAGMEYAEAFEVGRILLD